MAKPSVQENRDVIRQQNMLKMLQIENGYTVTDHTGKIWGFTYSPFGDPTETVEAKLDDCRQQALDFMNDWYATKEQQSA